MFNFNLTISLPHDKWEILESKAFPITKHKYIELSAYKCSDIFHAHISLTTKRDHAGFELALALFPFRVEFIIYDHRHWDEKNNKWEEHE